MVVSEASISLPDSAPTAFVLSKTPLFFSALILRFARAHPHGLVFRRTKVPRGFSSHAVLTFWFPKKSGWRSFERLTIPPSLQSNSPNSDVLPLIEIQHRPTIDRKIGRRNRDDNRQGQSRQDRPHGPLRPLREPRHRGCRFEERLLRRYCGIVQRRQLDREQQLGWEVRFGRLW